MHMAIETVLLMVGQYTPDGHDTSLPHEHRAKQLTISGKYRCPQLACIDPVRYMP